MAIQNRWLEPDHSEYRGHMSLRVPSLVMHLIAYRHLGNVAPQHLPQGIRQDIETIDYGARKPPPPIVREKE